MADQIGASHILLMYAGSERSTASRSQVDAQQLIGEIKDELDGGADFGALAKQHSDCPSKSEGGSLGKFSPGQMVPAFDKVAFGLEVGASGVVETPFGYHIIHRTA